MPVQSVEMTSFEVIGKTGRPEPQHILPRMENLLQPHRVKSFKLSTDPKFFHKLHDIVGLYLNPPTRPWC